MTRSVFGASVHSALAALLITLQFGCQPSAPRVSEQGQDICRQEAAAIGLSSPTAVRRQKECLRTIDQRLKQERTEQTRIAETTAEPEAVAPPATTAGRYVYCTTHKLEVKAANDRVASTLGPWMHANANLKPGDPEYEKARIDYEQAYSALEKLIPAEMRAGLPLLPNAARLFSTCERKDFFPE
ncbi:hypothetical protein VB734_04045 [Synechococcus sp. BA-124 BA4]|nr:hypothetical protein [Synechococcus sp. BA-124 BA4]